MKKFVSASLIWIPIAFSGAANAGPYEDGVAAYERKDYSTAAKMYLLAAKKGDARSHINLGMIYVSGEGVRLDYKEAMKWYRLSAYHGNAVGQLNVGFMYANGHGVTQDFKEAVKWYRLSSYQGNSIAQLNLAYMYADGQGVTEDLVRAHMWYNISAASGVISAKAALYDIAKKMSQTQIEKARKLARVCEESKYKRCE